VEVSGTILSNIMATTNLETLRTGQRTMVVNGVKSTQTKEEKDGLKRKVKEVVKNGMKNGIKNVKHFQKRGMKMERSSMR